MGMRRPLQVNEGTSNVPMLRHDDFDFEPFSSSAVALFRCRQLEDVSHQKRLATMFIEKVKLCQCIGRVLFAQYAPSQRQFGTAHRTTVTLVPRHASESEFSRCSQKLDSWLGALPKDARFIPASRSNFRDGEDVLILHGAMLRMLFHATTSTLHRPWAALSKEQSQSHEDRRRTARAKMHDAAAGITHIIQGLNQLNLTRFLPQSGLTVILPAAVSHLSNSMSDNAAVRESSMENFQRCIQVLHCLKDIYPAANIEFANLEAATKMRGDSNSNVFFQIMQYNFDPSTNSLNQVPKKPDHADSVANTHSLRDFDDKPFSETVTPARTPTRTRAPSMHEQYHHGMDSKPDIFFEQSRSRSQSYSHPTRRPFPNDFDDYFAATDDEPPFNFLSIDFDAFPDISDIPGQTTNLTPLTDDLADIDWTQALLGGTTSLPELDQSNSGFPHELASGRGAHRNGIYLDQQDHDQEQDLFDFALKDESDDGGGLRHHSNGDITGDLDRDLGFKNGEEGF